MWKFSSNEDGTLDGWNDPSIANFKSNIFKNLAREIIQNSIDAQHDKKAPVIVKFKLENLDRDQIPDLDTITECLEYISKNSAPTEGISQKKEIEESLKYSKKRNLPVLIIEDFNTSGMSDEVQKNSLPPFDKYLKSTGSSGGDQNRAGSHGIGKAAPLATTPLRTIFVGTMWEDKNGNSKTLYQGRSKLMYRKMNDNGVEKIKSGTGFWGSENFKPFLKLEAPKYGWLTRETRGTTIAVPGFRTNADREWMPIVAGYIAADFFAAIYRGALEVVLEDPNQGGVSILKIDKDSIRNPNRFFRNQHIETQIEKHTGNEASELEDAYYYYKCLSEEDGVEEFSETLLEEYKVRLRVLLDKDAPSKICFIRENMKITDNLKQGQKKGMRDAFWEPGKVPTAQYKSFAGVIEVLDVAGNNLFRSMEPAQHNALAIDNMPHTDRKLGEKLFSSLSKWLRVKIEEIAREEVFEARSIDEINEYFHDDEASSADSDAKTPEENIAGRFVFNRKKMKQKPLRPITVPGTGTEGGSGGTDGGGSGTDGGDGPGEGSGIGGAGKGGKTDKTKNIKLNHQRIVKSTKSNEYVINFEVPKAFNGYLKLLEIGLDGSSIVRIDTTNFADLEKIDGTIKVNATDFNEGLKKSFKVSLKEEPKGGLSVIASEKE